MSSAEIISIIIGFVSILIAFIAFKKDHYSKPVEELENLILHFNMTKALSEKVQQRIQDYIEKYNASDRLMFNGITFHKYLELMKENYKESFTTEKLDLLNSTQLSKATIKSLTDSLQLQFTNLLQVENMMKALI